MAEITIKSLPGKLVSIINFVTQMPQRQDIGKIYNLTTISSLSSHKNFGTFIEALKIMDTQLSRKITVIAVLDSIFESKNSAIPSFKNINITVKSRVSRQELFVIYQ